MPAIQEGTTNQTQEGADAGTAPMLPPTHHAINGVGNSDAFVFVATDDDCGFMRPKRQDRRPSVQDPGHNNEEPHSAQPINDRINDKMLSLRANATHHRGNP